MQSEKVTLYNRNDSVEKALSVADEYIKGLSVSPKAALRIRLLVEETLGMVRAMVGDFSSEFWLESDEKETRIRMEVSTYMNAEKKSSLLSLSKSGENVLAKGFMGMISDIIENGMLNFDSVMSLHQSYSPGTVNYAYMGMGMMGDMSGADFSYMWTLQNYRDSLSDMVDDDVPQAAEAWDQLEQSIVASLATDVIMGVKSDEASMTIVYEHE